MTEAATLERVTFNQSRIKTYMRCPKQFQYKYVENTVPNVKSRPLFLGSWVHACLEQLYKGGDWKIGHQEYVDQWNALFEEERMALRTRGRRVGPPLPEIVERIMRSYMFYYKNDGWKPVMVEKILEVETPLKYNGKYFVFKGRLDLVVEDDRGLWLVDHKTASTIPQANSYHAMDPQLMLYPWAAEAQYGLKLDGIIYNYVRSKPPTIPKLLKNGSLSKAKILTDYPTLYTFLKQNDLDPADFRDILVPMMKKSPDFLRRYRLPREKSVLREVVSDTLSVVKKIEDNREKRYVRNVTRDCSRMCAYHDLCRVELNGFDSTQMRAQMFHIEEEDYVVSDTGDAFDEESDLDE